MATHKTRPVPAGNGSPASDPRLAADELRPVDQHFQVAFERAAFGMALTSTEGCFLRVNHALCVFLDCAADELVGAHFASITHPDDVEIGLERARAALAGEIDDFDLEQRYVRADGTVVWGLMRASLVRHGSGAPEYFFTQIQDISERKREHEALERYVAALREQATQDREAAGAVSPPPATGAAVNALVAALAARDHHTGAHSRTVVELSCEVAGELGLDDGAVAEVEQVALLHDIGKFGIPDSILQKPGRLTDREWDLMREHPAIGARIIAAVPDLAHLAPAIRAEHERWDGGGYPDGTAGEEIPIASRITLACDAWHAMTSERPYRAAMSAEEAEHELQHNAGRQFDPEVVAALRRVLRQDR